MRIALPLIAMMLFGPVAALAQSGTRVVQHRAVDFLQGEFEGVAVDADGALVTAPVSQTRYFTPALYIWSMAFDRDGRVLAGTGDDGGVVREDGETFAEIAKLPGELVMAVADAGSGVLAATGPEGRIYRIDDDGNATAVVDRDETTAWALAPSANGDAWLAGFGPEATLVRFGPDVETEGEVLQTFGASVVRKLVRDERRLWLVTQGPSLIYQSVGDADRAERLRHDAGENEIPDAVADGAGGLWFLVLDPGDSDQMEPPSSRLMHLPAEGSAEMIWGGDLALMSLARTDDGDLLAGEIGASRVHRITPDGRISLWRDFGAGDASALLHEGDVTWVGSSNLGDVFRLAPARKGRGQFTSPAIATPAVEHWGRLWVDGDAGGARFAVRSGMRSEPDASWGAWSDWRRTGEAIETEPGDYLQYRLEIEDAAISGVSVSWARRNHAPRIGAVRFERGEGEDWSDGGPGGFGSNGGPRPVSVLRGRARVRVDAIDPDSDALRCTIEVRRLPDGDWYPLGGDPSALQADWDTTQFGDGAYQARAEVSDTLTRVAGRSAQLRSVPVTIDNTAPRLRSIRWDDAELRVVLEDEGSRITRVDLRVADEEDFRRIEASDGVTDGPVEEFVIARPADGLALWVRVRDAAGNETVLSPRAGN